MPGTRIHKRGRTVPKRKRIENKTVNSSGSRALKSRGARPRIHGGFDAGRIA